MLIHIIKYLKTIYLFYNHDSHSMLFQEKYTQQSHKFVFLIHLFLELTFINIITTQNHKDKHLIIYQVKYFLI